MVDTAVEPRSRDALGAPAGKPVWYRRLLKDWILPASFSIACLVAWQLVTVVAGIKEYILPAPTAVLASGVTNWAELQAALWPTLVEILLGFALAVMVGVAIGILLAGSPLMAKSIYPVLISSQVVPKVAIAPLFLIWFGFGTTPKVMVAFLMAFFPIAVNTTLGLTSVSVELRMLIRSMGASRWKEFWKVSLPHSLPPLFAGLKVGITLAVVGAVVGEFVGADSGLGYLILRANSRLDTPLAFAAIMMLTVLGVLLYGLIELAERWIVKR